MTKQKQPRFLACPVLISLGLSIFFFPGAAWTASISEKITIGEIEDVILLPWGVKMSARIDTGAATSSLDARDLKVKSNVAEFKLPKNHGGIHLRLPVVEWQTIRTADSRERRPVVEITLCMGPKLIRAKVTLNDRSSVTHPFIVGRNILRENFVVDCVQSKCLPPPSCPEGFSK